MNQFVNVSARLILRDDVILKSQSCVRTLIPEQYYVLINHCKMHFTFTKVTVGFHFKDIIYKVTFWATFFVNDLFFVFS